MQKEIFENGVQQLTTFLPVNMKTLSWTRGRGAAEA